MIFEISAKNMTLSTASQNLIAAYVQRMRRYFRRIYAIRWSFEQVRPFITAHLFVHARSGAYRASTRGETIREILVTTCDKIEKQRRRRKRQGERARRRNSSKLNNLKEIAPDHAAFLETDDFVD